MSFQGYVAVTIERADIGHVNDSILFVSLSVLTSSLCVGCIQRVEVLEPEALCLRAADVEALTTPYGPEGRAYGTIVHDCATDAFSALPTGELAYRAFVAACVDRATGGSASSECNGCFLDRAACRANACIVECLNPRSLLCASCRTVDAGASCDRDFTICAGFPGDTAR